MAAKAAQPAQSIEVFKGKVAAFMIAAMMGQMIALFTDFGAAGPYVGQTKAVLAASAPGVAVIDLIHDAPAYQP